MRLLRRRAWYLGVREQQHEPRGAKRQRADWATKRRDRRAHGRLRQNRERDADTAHHEARGAWHLRGASRSRVW